MKSGFFLLFVGSLLSAQSINVSTQWQLLGTSNAVSDLSSIKSSCIDSFWSYDGSWKDKNQLTSLKKEQGFWVKGSSKCSVELKEVGLVQLDSKIDRIKDFTPFTLNLKTDSNTIVTANILDNSLASLSIASNGDITLTPKSKYGSTKLIVIALKGDESDIRVVDVNFLQSQSETQSRGFVALSDTEWDEVAVRKVLQTFAYGGFALDSQIKTWADMNPKEAIKEMLTFEPTNLKLAPSSDRFKSGSIESLIEFWSAKNPYFDKNVKDYLSNLSWTAPKFIWLNMVNKRGLNPFRQKIGLWESNYHMAVNMNAGIYPYSIIKHYDSIMKKHEEGVNYEDVIAQGSKNSAVAYQYGHNRNVFKNGSFSGNEDFARELHQLFFGILGEYNPSEHEFYTVRNTARALTGIEAKWHSLEDGGADSVVSFNSQTHYPSSLKILNSEINGSNASEKLDNIAKVAINHEESLKNLPIMIVSNLADDNLDEDKKAKIIEAWQDMANKNFLSFIRDYATSTTFHTESRVKYKTTLDRLVSLTNLISTENNESYNNFYRLDWKLDDSSTPFYPVHDVFGGQRGLEAYSSANVFQKAYNLATLDIWFLTQITQKDSDKNIIYQKDFRKIIPKGTDGKYRVGDVAKWLWNRFVADGLKNFQTLEKAHIYSLLASGKDLGYFLDDQNPTKVYYKSDFEGEFSDVKQKIDDAEISLIDLDSKDEQSRSDANSRIALAIAFISATPYMFIEEGK